MNHCYHGVRPLWAFLLAWCLSPTTVHGADPPFWGTVWVDPDIIRTTDPSVHRTLSYHGVESRFVFDRRDGVWLDRPMHIFDSNFADGLAIEVRVNSNDFSQSSAQQHASDYAQMVGQLPKSVRSDVDDMTIHGGGALPFGGGSRGILVHVDVEPGTVPFLEEILFHEAAHATYGPGHDTSPQWLAAQAADPAFISLYARDNPTREDVAETLLMWYALRYRSDRLDAATIAATETAIPNRLEYFDALPFTDYQPLLPADLNADGAIDAADAGIMFGNWGSSGVGDLNVDGIVDAADAGEMFAVWTGDPSAVSEPSAVSPITVAAAGIGLLARRRCSCAG